MNQTMRHNHDNFPLRAPDCNKIKPIILRRQTGRESASLYWQI